MTSGDPRERLLDALADELRGGRLARRRILTELAHHIEDAVDDLRGSGVPREQAIEEAVRRLGDAERIANAFDTSRARTGPRLRVRHSLAWIAVAATSVVTVFAAELPQTSGAKPPASGSSAVSRRLAPRDHLTTRRPGWRARTAARPSRGRLADRG